MGQHIRQRVAALPARAQALLGAAAVAGRVAPSALLLAMASDPRWRYDISTSLMPVRSVN